MITIIPNNNTNLRVVLCYISESYGDAVEGLEGVTANVRDQPIIGWRIDDDGCVDPVSHTVVQTTDIDAGDYVGIIDKTTGEVTDCGDGLTYECVRNFVHQTAWSWQRRQQKMSLQNV